MCHDNSGTGTAASWFLKWIIVHDLQTREKVYFICEKWFALDKDDFQINRLIPACGEEQKKQFKHLFEKNTKQKLTDDHMWFSIFTRPAQSTFTRSDRLTCCFVLLFISMLMSLMYYDIESGPDTTTPIVIGPLTLSPQSVKKIYFNLSLKKYLNLIF